MAVLVRSRRHLGTVFSLQSLDALSTGEVRRLISLTQALNIFTHNDGFLISLHGKKPFEPSQGRIMAQSLSSSTRWLSTVSLVVHIHQGFCTVLSALDLLSLVSDLNHRLGASARCAVSKSFESGTTDLSCQRKRRSPLSHCLDSRSRGKVVAVRQCCILLKRGWAESRVTVLHFAFALGDPSFAIINHIMLQTRQILLLQTPHSSTGWMSICSLCGSGRQTTERS